MMERNGYVIRGLQAGDGVGILAAFNKVFREVNGPGFVDRDLETWRWIYEQNPAGTRVVVSVAPDGSVAGHYGGVPQRVRTPNGDGVIVHAVDSFVVAEHRRGLARPGLFVETGRPWFADCEERGDLMIYGYPVKRAMRIGAKYLGYTPMRHIEYLMRDVSEGQAQVGPGLVVDCGSEVPADVDALFDAVVPAHALAVIKNREYLEWRYRRAPQRDGYEFIVVRRDGVLRGFAVVSKHCALVPETTAIVEFVSPDERTADAGSVIDTVVAEASRIAMREGRRSVMTVAPPWSGFASRLSATGFQVRSSNEWLERTLSHNSFVGHLSTEWLSEHWYYMLGDSDLV